MEPRELIPVSELEPVWNAMEVFWALVVALVVIQALFALKLLWSGKRGYAIGIAITSFVPLPFLWISLALTKRALLYGEPTPVLFTGYVAALAVVVLTMSAQTMLVMVFSRREQVIQPAKKETQIGDSSVAGQAQPTS
jgi:hypothetical protein